MNMKLGGPQRQLGCYGNQKNFSPCQELNYNSLIVQPKDHCYNDGTIPAPCKSVCYPVYSTALHKQQVVAQGVKKFA
jgi:hypothetical protein